jgi:hypothetical protein
VTIYDDPNRESVGLAPIWTGAGEEGEVALDKMTKGELLEHAAAQGIEVDESMTKAEIRDAIG